MRASEHQGIDAGGLDWRKIFLGDSHQRRPRSDATLNKFNKTWASFARNLQVDRCGKGIVVSAGGNGRIGANHADFAIAS
ncbi:unannotated protein [freshwater metagenome]|uniref:Unannotated protein n=1 Tax=freshwater metagenome TaxID=449393 RepID=A0A6J6BP64_9ZZZZ